MHPFIEVGEKQIKIMDITSRTAVPTTSPPSSSIMPAGSSKMSFPTGTLGLNIQ